MARRLALVLALTAGIALGAQLALPVPLSPVPVSLQTLVVALAALLLPPLDALLAVALYLAVGALGLPVFAQGKAGLGALLGPTAGFLWAFLLAAPAARLARRPRRRFLVDLGVVLGLHALILATGVLWLATAKDLPLPRAAELGALPFLPGGLLKSLLAAALAALFRRGLRRALDGRTEP